MLESRRNKEEETSNQGGTEEGYSRSEGLKKGIASQSEHMSEMQRRNKSGRMRKRNDASTI